MKGTFALRCLALLLVFVFPILAAAQPIYQREYDLGYWGTFAMQPFGDGLLIAGGYGKPPAAGGLDASLMRLHADGTVAWAKGYGGSSGEAFTAMERLSDGRVALLGHGSSYVDQAGDWLNLYVVVVDSMGAVLQSKSIGTGLWETGSSIKLTPDNGFIILGTAGDSLGNQSPFLVKTDAALNVQWAQTYGNASYSENYANAVTQLLGGGYALTGYGTPVSDTSVRHMFVLRTDANGVPVFDRHFNFTDANYYDHFVKGSDIIQNAVGNLVAVGTVGGTYQVINDVIASPLLLELDLNGNVILSKSFYLNSGNCRMESVRHTNDAGYILGGTMGNDYLAMIKTDVSVATEWCYYYSQNFNTSGIGYGARQVPGGGFAMVGSLYAGSHVRIVRTDPSGNSSCQQAVPIGGGGASQNVSLGMTNGTWTMSSGADTVPAPTMAQNLTVNSTLVCAAVGIDAGPMQPSVAIYPNPAHDRVMVEVSGAEQLRVTNALGQVVHASRLDPLALNQTALDIANWPSGIYLVQAGGATQKLIKQ